jgi:hypothetical protein
VRAPFCINHGGLKRIFTNNKKRIDGDPFFEFGIHSKIPKFDLLSNEERYYLVSPKLHKAISTFDDTFQSFNVKDVDENEKQNLVDYKVINFIKTISCFDWDESIYDDEHKEYGIASHADKIVLDEEKIPDGTHIFLVQEMTSGIIFTETAKEYIEKNGFTGIKFVNLESFKY